MAVRVVVGRWPIAVGLTAIASVQLKVGATLDRMSIDRDQVTWLLPVASMVLEAILSSRMLHALQHACTDQQKNVRVANILHQTASRQTLGQEARIIMIDKEELSNPPNLRLFESQLKARCLPEYVSLIATWLESWLVRLHFNAQELHKAHTLQLHKGCP